MILRGTICLAMLSTVLQESWVVRPLRLRIQSVILQKRFHLHSMSLLRLTETVDKLTEDLDDLTTEAQASFSGALITGVNQVLSVGGGIFKSKDNELMVDFSKDVVKAFQKNLLTVTDFPLDTFASDILEISSQSADFTQDIFEASVEFFDGGLENSSQTISQLLTIGNEFGTSVLTTASVLYTKSSEAISEALEDVADSVSRFYGDVVNESNAIQQSLSSAWNTLSDDAQRTVEGTFNAISDQGYALYTELVDEGTELISDLASESIEIAGDVYDFMGNFVSDSKNSLQALSSDMSDLFLGYFQEAYDDYKPILNDLEIIDEVVDFFDPKMSSFVSGAIETQTISQMIDANFVAPEEEEDEDDDGGDDSSGDSNSGGNSGGGSVNVGGNSDGGTDSNSGGYRY